MSDEQLTETPKYQAENLEGLAQGILESATDVPSGKAALIQAYQKYNWDDPQKALGIVEYYGEAVRNKLQDQTPIRDLNGSLPVSLTDVLPDLPKDATDIDLYNKWEEINKVALDNNTDPFYAVNKPLLLKQLKQEASNGRRQANSDAYVNDNAKELGDIANRFSGAVAKGLGVEAVAHAAGYDLNNWVTEYTDPERDNKFFSKAASVVGNAAGGYLAFATGGVVGGTAAGIAQGADIVANTYSDTLANTGDPSKAAEAGAIEAAAQIPQLFGERLVLGGAAKPVEEGIKTVFGAVKNVAKAAATQALAAGTSQVISNQAADIKDRGNPDVKDTSALRGVAEAAGLGAIAGGFIQAGTELNPIPPSQVLGAGNDPTIRQREIDSEGAPQTTVVKQVVGDLFKPVVTPSEAPKSPVISKESLIPSEEGASDKTLYSASKDVAEQAVVPEDTSIDTTQPVFTTDRNVTYHEDGIGHIEGKAVILPSEKQIFLTSTDHQIVSDAVSKGAQVYLDSSGTPILESKTDVNGDTQTTREPIKNASFTPEKDTYAWNINSQKMPFKGQILRQTTSAGRVISVNDIPLKSVGAAERTPDALTQFSQKVIQSEGVIPEEAKTPVGYYIAPNEQTATDAANLVRREGFDKVYEKAINDPQSLGTNLEQQGVIGHAIQNFIEGQKKAIATGDFAEYDRLTQESKKFLALPHVQGTDVAQALQYRSTFPFEPLRKVNEAYQEGVESYTAENLPEIQKNIEEVAQRGQELQRVKQSLEPAITPEEAAVEKETLAAAQESHAQDISLLDSKIEELKKQLKDNPAQESKLNAKLNNLEEKKSRVLTPEERATKNPTYKKIQLRREKTINENKSKLTAAEKAYNESILRKNRHIEAAREAGIKKAEIQQMVNDRQAELEAFKKNNNLTKSQRAVVDDQLSLLDIHSKTGPNRFNAYSYWLANQVGNGTNILAATLTSGLLGIPLAVGSHVNSSVRALFNNITHGSLAEYKYPMLSFLKGALGSSTTLDMAVKLGKAAIFEGKRFEGVAKREEILGQTRLAVDKQQEFIHGINQDFKAYLQGKTQGEKFYTWATKNPVGAVGVVLRGTTTALTEPFLRGLMTVEAVTKSLHAGGMDEAARDFYYNEALRKGDKEAASQYKYNRAALWEKAKATASLNVDGLKKLGIETSKGEQHIQALESYYENLPRQVMVDAQKRSQQMVYNGPAAGLAGAASRLVQAGADLCAIPIGNGRTVNPVKYLTAFSNAGAHAINLMLESTPLSIASAYFPSGPKSPMERSMLLSSGMVSLGLLGGLAAKALTNLDQDENKRVFDIIGKFSSDPKKTATFLNSGGSQYSIRIGNQYYSFKDTQLAMGFGAVAAIVDMKRDGKLTDAELQTQAGVSTALMMGSISMLTAPAQISFMRTLGSLYDSFSKASQAAEKGDVAQAQAVGGVFARQLISITKGFIPGAGVLRTMSHYTDNPVEAQKDIQSALVQNIPYFQTQGIAGVKPLPALNVLGEVLDTKDHTGIPPIHRIFSTKKDDVDIRWMVDNGYTIPDPYQVLTKKNHTLKGLGIEEGLTTRQEHALAQVAAPANREILSQFRESLGSSAFSDRAQKRLNKAIRRNYAMAAARLGLPALEDSEASGQVE